MTRKFTLQHCCKKLVLPVLLAVSIAVTVQPLTAGSADIWAIDKQAKQDVQQGNLAAAAAKWHILLDYFLAEGSAVNAALYAKELGHYYDLQKQYGLAIYFYELENTNWLKSGNNWGAADLQRADEIRTTLDLYVSTTDEQLLTSRSAAASGGLAKFEPLYGAYIGMYSEGDPQMGNHYDRSEAFYNKKHALYLAYAQWGKPFPARYAGNAKSAGAALQIAYEPSNGLAEVADGTYIREWARQAKAAGIPIFLRYASEMNGAWVNWHGDPAQYIAKFRLIHDIMEQEAPNMAMVWSPGDVPLNTMAEYYPGDDYVDWVGVSMYTDPYENGDPSKPFLGLGPVERLDELYRLYADRKPVMISETAVSHYTHQDDRIWTDWSVMNLDRLYSTMTKKYPRLKSITYFNRDQGEANSYSDYLLRDNETMMATYKSLISDSYFLTKVEQGAKPAQPRGYLPAGSSIQVARSLTVAPYVKLPDVTIGRVEYALNGTLLTTQTKSPFRLELWAGSVATGSVLEVRAYNQAGIMAAAKSISIDPEVSVRINGKLYRFEQPPVLVNELTLAPVRAVFETLGATVEWNEATQTVTGRKGSTVVKMTIGNRTVTRNGSPVQLDAAPRLINGYTMVPARFAGEAFGAKIGWEEKTATILIDTP